MDEKRGRLTKEVEFEFVDSPTGGEFVATSQVRSVILRHLTLGEIDAATSLVLDAGPGVSDELLSEDLPGESVATRMAAAEVFLRHRDYARAGRAAMLIGDPDKAAPYLERAYQFERAAELYERTGKLAEAAELYDRGLQHDRAARLFEQAGTLERAAESWLRAGDPYEAGRLFVKTRHLGHAVTALGQVPPEHRGWATAMQLLGKILETGGRHEEAIQRYIQVVKARAVDATTVGVYERLGEIYAECNEPDRARKLLDLVLAFDPTRERARRTMSLLPPPKSPVTTQNSGAFSMNSIMPPVTRGALESSPGTDTFRVHSLQLPHGVVTAREGSEVAPLPSIPTPVIRRDDLEGALANLTAAATVKEGSHVGRVPAAPSATPTTAPPPKSPNMGGGGATGDGSTSITRRDLMAASSTNESSANDESVLPHGAAASASASNLSLLRRVAVLKSLNAQELQLLASLGHKVAFPRGTILARPGAQTSHVSVIVEGRVSASVPRGKAPFLIAEYGPGAFLGELGLADQGPDATELTVEEATTVIRWEMGDLIDSMDRDPSGGARLRETFMRIMATRLRDTYARIATS